ncbi:HEAT repeat domain-containing protein [Lyngbya aestuarii]|uniref:HEAT repeat domain-containing protein n=1 Tax=Lyngbya aestuarii TaxID=118322 RepID=UPI00403DE770
MISKDINSANTTEPQTPNISGVETSLASALEMLAAGDFQERWEAQKLFTKLGVAVITPLVELLESEQADLELCWFVARILGQFDDPNAIATLVKLLTTSESEDVKAMAATALASLGTKAIAPLSHLLKQPQQRLLAVQSLSQIYHPDTIEPLLSIVNDPQPVTRATALAALGHFPDHNHKGLPLLVQALDDPAASVRLEAIIGLGRSSDQFEDKRLVELLQQRLEDEDLAVRQQAAVALGRCGTDGAAVALFEVLRLSNTPVALQLTIVRVLSWMETSLALHYLQQLMTLESVSLAVSQEVVLALGQMEKPHLQPTASAILSNLILSGHPAAQQRSIRQAIALGLGRLGGMQAFDVLTQLLVDSDAKVRLHAQVGLKQLQAKP